MILVQDWKMKEVSKEMRYMPLYDALLCHQPVWQTGPPEWFNGHFRNYLKLNSDLKKKKNCRIQETCFVNCFGEVGFYFWLVFF